MAIYETKLWDRIRALPSLWNGLQICNLFLQPNKKNSKNWNATKLRLLLFAHHSSTTWIQYELPWKDRAAERGYSALSQQALRSCRSPGDPGPHRPTLLSTSHDRAADFSQVFFRTQKHRKPYLTTVHIYLDLRSLLLNLHNWSLTNIGGSKLRIVFASTLHGNSHTFGVVPLQTLCRWHGPRCAKEILLKL